MLRPRVIPCLLIHQRGLVKTVRFRDPKYVGDPINAVKIFNEKEADELVVLDIDATVNGTEPDYRMIGHLAVECRMPLCYGGGVRTVEQASRIISLGVEKVALGSLAMEQPETVSAIAREIGRQSVVVVLDVRKRSFGRGYGVFSHNGKRDLGKDVVAAAREAEACGAGEIVINSIDNDGVMKGYDIPLVRQVQQATAIPTTALGGAGSLDDVAELVKACGVVGAAAGSLFVFKGAYRAVLINYPNLAVRDELVRSAMPGGVVA
jgi:imidazole glycerol-phosphate synthase subunit HisF